MSNFSKDGHDKDVLHTLLSVSTKLENNDPQVITILPGQFNDDPSQNLLQIPVSLGENKDSMNSINWYTSVDNTICTQSSNDSEHFDQISNQIIWTDNLTTSTQPSLEHLLTNACANQSVVHLKPKLEKGHAIKVNEHNNSGENRLEENPTEVKIKLKQGCDCRESCYRGLSAEAVYRHRLNIAELTKSEHDMYLMGVTMACLSDPAQTSRRKERKRLRASYVYQGRRVCLDAFLYLENVTHYQLKRIRKHVMQHGVAPRIHGNMGKKPYNTFSLDIYKHTTKFIKHYLQSNLGARDISAKNIIIQGDTRKNIYNNYLEYGRVLTPGAKLMGYSTFRHFIRDQFPHIKFTKLDKKDCSKSDCKVKSKIEEKEQKEIVIAEAEMNAFQDATIITADLSTIEGSQDNIELQNVHVLSHQNHAYILTPMPTHVLHHSLEQNMITSQNIHSSSNCFGN